MKPVRVNPWRRSCSHSSSIESVVVRFGWRVSVESSKGDSRCAVAEGGVEGESSRSGSDGFLSKGTVKVHWRMAFWLFMDER